MFIFRLNSSENSTVLSYENSTGSAYEAITATSILQCIPMILVSMASFFGNALVLGAIYRFKKLRTFANAYVGSLAITDIVASAVMPLSYITVLLNGRWVLGDAMCNMQGYFLTMLSSASMLTLLFFSMYRCYLVTTVRKRLTEQTVGRIVKSSVCLVWLLSALYAMPPLFDGGQIKYIRAYSSCLLDFTSSRYYAEFLFISVFTTPLVVMLIAYVRIIKFIRIHNRTITKSTRKRPRSEMTPSSSPSAEEEEGNRYTVMELKRRLEVLNDQNDIEGERTREGNLESEDSEEGGQAIELQKLKSNKTSLSPESEYVSDKIQSYSPQKRAITKSLDDGARSLDDGARSLDDGARSRDDGARRLDDGARRLDDGARSLDDGARRLDDGARRLDDGARSLDDGARSREDGARSPDDGARSRDEASPSGKSLESLNKISVSSVLQKWRARTKNRQVVLKQYRKRVTHQARLVRVLLVTVVTFLICWAPFSFDSFLQGIGYTDPRPRNFQLTSVWLAYSNAICNPVIYALLNKRFRAAFKTILQELVEAVFICRR